MGYYAPNAIQTDDKPWLMHAFPKVQHTNNNKLQMSARALELIYTVHDWPPGQKCFVRPWTTRIYLGGRC